jgi:signal transduction histidine kinase
VLHDQGLPEKAVQFLNMADQSVTRLDGTIQEILEYSRNSRLDIQPEWMDLSVLVQNIFDDLKFITEDPLEMVMAFKSTSLLFNDKARISVLLKNIIGNSVKYRKAGQQSVVKFSFDFNDTHAVMQIEDNGQGIDENHIGRVFEMFFRGTSASIGTGLGLYICKEIVSKLGGEIQVKSQKGLGTTMTISLPLIQNEI